LSEALRDGLRSRGAALALLTLVCASAFIGRSVNTSDGAEVVSESLGFFVQGHPGYGRIPEAGPPTPESVQPAHSKYGLYASLLPLPALAPAWLLRRLIGASGVDALTALTWTFGTALAALAFGSLVRALRPGSTGPWEGAFVAGTFLWPYAADSFVEPFAAAGLAAGAALALSGRAGAAAAPWAAACLLKPILWVTVPLFFLATALEARRARSVSGTLPALGVFAAALCLHGLGNLALYGSLLETGYGSEILRFTTPLGDGLFGLLLAPGRSVFLYAPVAAVGLLGLSRAPRPARILCAGTPLLLLFVVARWWSWEGGASWGPRHLLPALPLLVAPAALVSRGIVRAAFIAGAFVNMLGVLVAPGSWDGYAERLRPPAGASWPAAGPVRVATIPALSPISGHAWLAARNLAGIELPKAWLGAGTAEGDPPPTAAESVSPWLLRRAMGLPPLSPLIPRLLVRSAAGYLARGEAARAVPWAREAMSLSPADPDASRLLAYAEAEIRSAADR
jgi:hypothetical protein